MVFKFVLVCLALAVCSAKDCKLVRKSLWSRYDLKCKSIKDSCPLKRKTMGIGGIKTVTFQTGCPSVVNLEKWIKSNAKVLYPTTKYFFNCSCEAICFEPEVKCAYKCRQNKQESPVGAMIGVAASCFGFVAGVFVVWKLIRKFQRRARHMRLDLENAQIGDDDGDRHNGEDEDDIGASGGNDTEVKVVDVKQTRSGGSY